MVRVRKNANTLTPGERDRFAAALVQLNNQGMGRFADFRDIHTAISSAQARRERIHVARIRFRRCPSWSSSAMSKTRKSARAATSTKAATAAKTAVAPAARDGASRVAPHGKVASRDA